MMDHEQGLATENVVRRIDMVLYLAATALYWFSLYLYVPILGPFSEELGSPLSFVGLIVGSYGFVQLVLRIPTGIFSDRIGQRKPFIVFGFFVAVVSAALMATATTPWSLFIGRSVSGLAATMWVTMTVLFASYFPQDKAGYAMGLIMSVTTGSQLVATFAGGYVAEIGGWSAPFWGAAIAGCIGLVISTALKKGRVEKTGLSLGALFTVGKSKNLQLVALLAALIQYVIFVTVYGFTPNYAVTLGATKADLGWLTMASILPAAIASYVAGGWLTERWGEGKIVIGGFLITAFGTFVIPFTTSVGMLLWTQVIGGFGRGVIMPILMGMSIKTVPSKQRATAMGFFQSIYALGMFLGPAVSGVLGQWFGMGGMFVTSAIVALVAALWSVSVFRQGGALFTAESQARV